MRTTVSGASDDLIEIDGAISEEFTYGDESEANYLAFSNGIVMGIEYTALGVWKITRIAGPPFETVPAEGPDSDNYSDHAHIDDPVEWVVFGHRFEKAAP